MNNPNPPYTDCQYSGYTIRTFHIGCDDMQLVWHRDRLDRLVTCISGDGWQLQMDNELPFNLIGGLTYIVPKMVYHRLIRTKQTQLIIKIVEEGT